MNHTKKKLVFFGIGFLVLLGAAGLFLSFEHIPGHRELKVYLDKQLSIAEPLLEKVQHDYAQESTVIYVLGGSEKSLEERYKTAAFLYHEGLSKRILILSVPGITEYDPALGRNLTNDEWSVKQLTRYGVKSVDVEPVTLHKGLLGTFTEASGIPELVARRGYKQLILVTSLYHTKRTWVSFTRMSEDGKLRLAIYGADDPEGLSGLLYEYRKLALYTQLLLPKHSVAKQSVGGQSLLYGYRQPSFLSLHIVTREGLPMCVERKKRFARRDSA